MHLLGVEMGCFHVSSSPAAFSVAQQQPAAVACSFRPVVRRRAHSAALCSPSPPRLQMMLRPAAETPRPRLACIRAQNHHVGDGDGYGDGDRPLPPGADSSVRLALNRRKKHNFPKEDRHISSHLVKLILVIDGLLVCMDVISLVLMIYICLCLCVNFLYFG
jgi:hypothetical protein